MNIVIFSSIILFTFLFPIIISHKENNLWYLSLYTIIGIPIFVEILLFTLINDCIDDIKKIW